MKAVDHYLAVRRSVGFKLKTVEGLLRAYAHFAAEQGDSHVVNKTAIGWASQAKVEAQRANRLNTVIRFARFVRAEDDRHEIPPDGVFCGHRQRPTPYIFSEDEIRRLVVEARRLGPPESLRPHTYSTLFGLIATTGLRVSETINLRLRDLTRDGLVVRESKCRKSRLLPLHSSTFAALERYLTQRLKFAREDDHLFISRRCRGLGRAIVRKTFRKLLKVAGIPQAPDARRPRVMDLRHSFAVHALENCPDTRDCVRGHMLALTTYMGHGSIEATYWYLEATSELMIDIAQSAESFVHGGVS